MFKQLKEILLYHPKASTFSTEWFLNVWKCTKIIQWFDCECFIDSHILESLGCHGFIIPSDFRNIIIRRFWNSIRDTFLGYVEFFGRELTINTWLGGSTIPSFDSQHAMLYRSLRDEFYSSFILVIQLSSDILLTITMS